MILDLDADGFPQELETFDICIAGGGIAGITLALKLAQRGRRILLLEAGGRDISDKSQDAYRGEIIGQDYYDLDMARLRYLGGTSNHWSGWCRPLDIYDFEKRDHIPDSGWPISIEDIRHYLDEARDILEIEPFNPDREIRGSQGKFKEIDFRFSPPVRFGSKYAADLAASNNITVLLNANLVGIKTSQESGRVISFSFRGYDNTRGLFEAKSKQYVLALGGIENARILLNASADTQAQSSIRSPLVGRYFMEHPHYYVGAFVPNQEVFTNGFNVAPTRKLIMDKKIANAGLRVRVHNGVEKNTNFKDDLKKFICNTDVLRDFASKVRGRRMVCPKTLEGIGTILAAFEQVPNLDSRITLADEKDNFGLQRTVLDWQLTEADKKTLKTLSYEIAKYFVQTDLGRVRISDWILEGDAPNFPDLDSGEEVAGFHHMGTTRMGFSKQDGVVDRDCRMFGHDNLYVAGSSVFRTSGHANPTLTIVQLTLRLAEHLAGE